MTKNIKYILAAGLVALACSAEVFAQQLTTLGAIAGANADGSIPAFTGGLSKAPAGFDASNGYKDPFADEKPLVVIDQSNYQSHEALLTAGQIALIKRYANYKVPIYPTHRTATFSDAMLNAIKTEAGKVKLVDGGRGLSNVQQTSVPFPQPSSGIEAVWNTLLRRPAQTLTSHTAGFVSGQGVEINPISTSQTIAWAPALERQGSSLLFSLIGETTRPSAQAGEALLVNDTLNFAEDSRQAWIINAGQRRVIRAPELVHAAPAGNSDALRTVDDIYGFNGSPERFDWKLIGRKELYIPYNNYRLSDKSLKYSQLVDGPFIKPELTRFEKHRVWVIEGTLKPGAEHIYSKRVMYVDEDSWYVALMDQYDTKGELWRTKALYLMQAYDAPGMYTAGEMQHDLNARKTIFSGFHNEEKPTEFNVEARSSDFTQAALRRKIR